MFVFTSFGIWDNYQDVDSNFGVVVLYIAECLSIGLSAWLRNPLFAAVFLWILAAIRSRQKENARIQKATATLLIIHAIYVVGLTTWLIVDKVKNSPLE